MYPLRPMKVFVLDRVYRDPVCAARLERVLAGLATNPGVTVITADNLGAAAAELQTLWTPGPPSDSCPRTYMRPLLFTTMDLSYDRPDLSPLLKSCPAEVTLATLQLIFGQIQTAVDQHPHNLDRQHNCVCWPTYNFGTMVGCPHGCLYCGAGRAGRFITIALNLEEYMEKVVGPIIEANPWNKVFRMILHGSDLIAFEPEYQLHDLFTRKLAQYDERWGHFHTSGANVEWMAQLPHRDRLVGVWSATCDPVARIIEPGAGPAIERIEAGRKCQEMGIPARFKFKPVIPIRGWREAYADIIREALTRAQPESMGFGLYMWNTYESLIQVISPDLLDPVCLDAAKGAVEQMKGNRCGPFPHETRKEIYRFLIAEARKWSKDVLLYISTESREMWDELKDELGQDPRHYVCACSSVAAPGRRLALSPGFRYSTYHATPV